MAANVIVYQQLRRYRPLLVIFLFFSANVVMIFNARRIVTDVARRDTEAVDRPVLRYVTLLDDYGLGCQSLQLLRNVQLVASGWTKSVYRGQLTDGTEVAVKVVNMKGHDMVTCLAKINDEVACYKQASSKILKEIVLLKELQHPNILKVLGYCIPNEMSNDVTLGVGGIALITQLGETLDIIRLLQSSWEDRLSLMVDVTRILRHLATSPLGSLVMNDFRRQQFVLVNNQLQLSDVDDVEFEEPLCSTDEACTIRHKAADLELPVRCVSGSCQGYNEKQNIYNAGRHFVSALFPHGAPTSLRSAVDEVVSGYVNVSWDTERLQRAVENLHNTFITGKYLPENYRDAIKGYIRVDKSDFSGLFDYRCQRTVTGSGCTMSVFDEAEAGAICDHDSDCSAFVMTPHKSLTGRHIVHFKSNVSGEPQYSEQSTLYFKIS
ncbi:hypothetical protein CHUAL_009642 [Chamberlinius hualienensis]